MQRFKLLAAATMLACGLTSAHAADLTKAQSHAVIDEIAKLVEKDYVFPEKRAGIVAELRKREAEGRYDIANPSLFAQTLSDDMVAISHDKHMWFQYDPQGYKAALLPEKSDGAQAYLDAATLRDNHGYSAMRILPGNVRYVNLSGFEWNGAATTQTVTDVARFLGGADAIIFDVSGNGGGAAEAVQAIVSYFLPADNRVLVTFHDGMTGKSDSNRVLDKLAAPRLVGKPLYVLISRSTGSAAEEFTYHVKNFRLGTLIGTTTAGAANNDTVFPIAPFFLQSISTGRPEHPVTHGNWEGTGIAPDIEAPQGRALDVAYEAALKGLIANGGAEHRADYEWALVPAAAKLKPYALEATALPAYAGQYGARKVWVEDGRLMFQREGRDATELLPLSSDLFAFANNETIRARFIRDGGKVTGFDMLTFDGQVIPVKKT